METLYIIIAVASEASRVRGERNDPPSFQRKRAPKLYGDQPLLRHFECLNPKIPTVRQRFPSPGLLNDRFRCPLTD